MNESHGVRPAAVAGYFYPKDPIELREAIHAAFQSPLGPRVDMAVNPDGPHRVFGVMAPHAGYQYSAQGTAWSFAEIAADGRPDVIVLLGVNHRGLGAPLALSPASAWQTPLGLSPVDGEMATRLQRLDPKILTDAQAHQFEHSLEVQVPFIQALFGELPIMPLLLGQLGVEDVRTLAAALATVARERNVVIVASSDLSHYLPARDADVLDHLALQQVAAVDADGLLQVVQRRQITMCGVLPVAAMLTAAASFEGVSATILHYHTSGDVTGDRQDVVGYGSAAIYR